MWRTRVVNLAIALCASVPLLAQETGSISGTVTTAEGGRALASVAVTVSGTSARAATDAEGRYLITGVAPGTWQVTARRIGYTPSTISVTVTPDVQATANFQLAAAATVLGEIVSIGYGEQEVRDRTGVVDVVTPEEFNTGRIVSPEQLIQGKVAGVQVVDNNEPGGGLAIRIRGGTSVGASNEPLYVIDGVPLQVGGGASAGRNPLNFLNPNDIESVTVLKDASSTAIYGSRGANGVILVTTKSGATGPQFTYQGTVSRSQVTGGPDLLGAEQYRAAIQQYGSASTKAAIGTANTDWLAAIQRDATGMEHNIGFNGRKEQMAYRLGLGFLDQDGVLLGTRTQRTSLSLNYNDQLFSDRLNLRANLKGTRTKDWFTPGGVLGSATYFAPTQPIRTSSGGFYEWSNTLGVNNPLKELELVQDNGTALRSVGALEGEYKVPFVAGLSTTIRGSYDIVRADRTRFTPSTAQSQIEGSANTRGNFFRDIPEQQSTILDAYATYDRDLGWLGSSVDVTAGYSTERFRGDYPIIYAEGLSTDLLGQSGVPSAFSARPGLFVDETRLVSGFGRANFNLLDRYLFTATVRRDGSSRFATENQYGTFPSAAFAWRILEEPFLHGRTPLSDLKLRLSWGVNGNQSVGNYLSYTSYTYGQNTAQAQLGNEFVPTIRPSGSDPDLQWERTTSTNLGLDYGFLANRVTGSVELYTKKTTDLLFNVQTAAGTALSNFVTTNLGTVQNRGVELTLDADVMDGGEEGFRWNALFNAAMNRNELVSLDRPGLTSIATGGVAGGVGTTIQVFQPGQPVNSFFVYEHIREGGKPVFRDRNGDGNITDLDLFVDRNGDRVINTADLRPFHDPAPKWMLGHTSNVAWRNFDASTTLRAYLGNYVYNNVASNQGHYGNISGSIPPAALHSSVLENGFTRALYLSDVYVEEASFLRMDNLTFGFTVARFAAAERPRVFLTIQNVFTTTKYSGVDPTSGVNGIDNTIYPRSRTYLGGVSLGF